MKAIISLILVIVLFSSNSFAETFQEALIVNAHRYIGEKEITPNRSPNIDKFHKYVGIPVGNPYCASFQIYNCGEVATAKNIKNPLPKIARVSLLYKTAKNNPLKYKVYSTKALLLGVEKNEIGDFIIWKSGTNVSIESNWNGHIGITEFPYFEKFIRTIEANTGSGNKGNQRDGDGIWQRKRALGVGTSFEVVGFIRLKGVN